MSSSSLIWSLVQVIIPQPQNVCGGGGALMETLCRVGRSVRPSPFSCPLYKSYTNWRIFFKLGLNVHLNKGMCRTHVAYVSAQGQGLQLKVKYQTIKY
jgi:hypothetical protein